MMLGQIRQIIAVNHKPMSNIFFAKHLVFNSSSLKRTIITCRNCCALLGKNSHDQLNSPINRAIYMICSVPLVEGLCHKKIDIEKFQKRLKSKKPQKRPEYDSDSDKEEEDDEFESKSTKPVTLKLQSLRMDGLLKKTLGIARNKAETAFYEGSIRVNGAKPSKKSYQVRVGDEVDLIKGVSPLNPDFLAISRVEVLSVTEDPDEEEEQLIVKLRRTKTMYIENYESHPWKKGTSAE